MRYKFLFIVVFLLLMLYVAKIDCGTCPTPSVKKRTIIQSSDSINKGAKLIGKDVVESARHCFRLCCNDLSCNIAVMHYKEKTNVLGEAITEKYCFLFSCGSPSVCTYEYHHRYAIIDLGDRKDERNDEKNTKVVTQIPSTVAPITTTTTTTAATTTTTTTTTTPPTTTPPTTVTIPPTTVKNITASITPAKSEVPSTIVKVVTTTVVPDITKTTDDCSVVCGYNYDPVCGDDGETYDNKCLLKHARCKKPSLKMDYDERCRECPPGVAMAMCSDDPCTISSCPTNKHAHCKANFCGGCNAVYYDKDGGKVNCSDTGVVISLIHNEQAVTVSEADYEETPDESLPHGKVHIKDPYYSGEKRKWLGPTKHNETDHHPEAPVVVVVKESGANSLMSLPLLIALIICIVLLIGVIYRVKCVTRGRAKKLPVDDGDYLINGMYL